MRYILLFCLYRYVLFFQSLSAVVCPFGAVRSVPLEPSGTCTMEFPWPYELVVLGATSLSSVCLDMFFSFKALALLVVHLMLSVRFTWSRLVRVLWSFSGHMNMWFYVLLPSLLSVWTCSLPSSLSAVCFVLGSICSAPLEPSGTCTMELLWA